MEAAGLAFGVLPVVMEGVKQCRAACRFYKDTRRFGIDYNTLALKLRGEMARLRAFESICTDQAMKYRGYRDDELVKDVERRLALMRDIFAACHEIQAKYQGLNGDLDDNDTNVTRPMSDEINTPTIRVNEPMPLSEDRIRERRKRQRRWFGSHLSLHPPRSPNPRSRTSSMSTSHPSSPTTTTSSQEQAESSLVLTQPTELDDVSVTMHEADQRMQGSAKLMDRIAWVDHRKEKLDNMIRELKGHNDFFLTIIQLSPSHDLSFHLPGQKPIQSSCVTSGAQNLERLHHQLRASNRSSNPVRFSLKIELDNQTKEQMEFDDDARVHFLQAYLPHKCQNPQDNQYIYVEESGDSSYHSTGSLSGLNDIASLLSANPSQDDPMSLDHLDSLWKQLGSVGHDDTVKVSRDSSNNWFRFLTLSDVLKESGHKEHLLSAHLAALLAYSYAISANLHKKVYPTTNDYVYYRISTEQEPPLAGDWILSPYLDFGIGSRPRPISTNIPGIRFASNNAVFSLGLLLHQVGLWKFHSEWSLDVDQSSLATRKRTALDELASLTREMGLPYRDIVKKCLVWSRDSRTQEQGVEFRQLERVFNDMSDYIMVAQEKVVE